MIELTVDAAGLARSRFVVSPLHEVAATLLPWGLRRDPEADPWVTRARRVLRRARLPLLSELALDGGGYLPDFLSPHPSGPRPPSRRNWTGSVPRRPAASSTSWRRCATAAPATGWPERSCRPGCGVR